MSSKRYSKEQRLEMLERYKNGESAGSIAKSFGCYTQTVLRVLRRNGVTIRKSAGKDHHMHATSEAVINYRVRFFYCKNKLKNFRYNTQLYAIICYNECIRNKQNN